MGIVEAVKSCFGKYATFSGRASRSEYWFFCLFNFLMGIVTCLVPFLSVIYSIVAFIPGIAVFVRRMHDTNHSGWWWFMCLLPIIGWIWVLVLLCTGSDQGANDYGELEA